MPESECIDLNEPMTVADLIDKAGVPDSVDLSHLTITYGGCGSHGVVLEWPGDD